MNTGKTSMPSWLGLVLWLAASLAAGVVGSIASRNAPVFYAQLAKPEWAPPAGVFGPVWTGLYLLMGVAAWLVWRERPATRTPYLLFFAQLAANALWSWLFFEWHRGAWAFAEILALLALIVLNIAAFWRVKALAGVLMLPYLCWVSFATALTYAVWQRNPGLL